KVHVKKGSKVKVGDVLLTLEAAGAKQSPPKADQPPPAKAAPAKAAESAAPAKKAAAPAARAAEVTEVEPAAPAPKASAAGTATVARAPRRATAPAGPATRRLARELGVDINQIQGTGPGGRITEVDVKAAVRQSGGGTRQAPPPSMLPRAVPLP